MSEANKALARRLFDAINAHDLDAAHKLYAADATYHDLPPGMPKSWETVVTAMTGYFEAFPDMQTEIEEIVADGDKVAVRYRWTGTHSGPLLDIPATGKKVNQSGAGLYRFAGGKIVESWLKGDQMNLMQQLGVMPTPGG